VTWSVPAPPATPTVVPTLNGANVRPPPDVQWTVPGTLNAFALRVSAPLPSVTEPAVTVGAARVRALVPDMARVNPEVSTAVPDCSVTFTFENVWLLPSVTVPAALVWPTVKLP